MGWICNIPGYSPVNKHLLFKNSFLCENVKFLTFVEKCTREIWITVEFPQLRAGLIEVSIVAPQSVTAGTRELGKIFCDKPGAGWRLRWGISYPATPDELLKSFVVADS